MTEIIKIYNESGEVGSSTETLTEKKINSLEKRVKLIEASNAALKKRLDALNSSHFKFKSNFSSAHADAMELRHHSLADCFQDLIQRICLITEIINFSQGKNKKEILDFAVNIIDCDPKRISKLSKLSLGRLMDLILNGEFK